MELKVISTISTVKLVCISTRLQGKLFFTGQYNTKGYNDTLTVIVNI